MDEINNQILLPKYDKWIFYYNTRNFKAMPDPVRDALQKMFYNKNPIMFDKNNRLHTLWDDWLHQEVERELYMRDNCGYEMDTFKFAKYLCFIDPTKEQLHAQIRHEIFNRRLNYTKEENTDSDYSTEYED